MIFNVTIEGATETKPLRVGAEFKTAANEEIERYNESYLRANDVLCNRNDKYILVPYGRFHIGYNFKADLSSSTTVVDLVLHKESGSEYREEISIESFYVIGFQKYIDSSRDLVLSYQGPEFGENDSLSLVAGKVGDLGRPVGEWSALTGNRLLNSSGELIIPSSKLKNLPKGEIKFKFHRSSQRLFKDGDMHVNVTQFSPPLFIILPT